MGLHAQQGQVLDQAIRVFPQNCAILRDSWNSWIEMRTRYISTMSMRSNSSKSNSIDPFFVDAKIVEALNPWTVRCIYVMSAEASAELFVIVM